MRQTVAVKGARENNLKNIELEIPREQHSNQRRRYRHQRFR